ncbi:MAG TPA: hypothetical protein VK915_00750 [Gaiellaceae bacterium]|nr:hypothetical protein [Gaiellaceae bacterium]
MTRRLALALPVALAVLFAGCSGEDAAEEEPEEAATALTAVFHVTGDDEIEESYELECDPPGGDVEDAAAVCERLAVDDVTLLPDPTEPACTLPAGLTTLDLGGALAGEEVDVAYAPCSREEDRAIAEWAAIFGFQYPPLGRWGGVAAPPGRMLAVLRAVGRRGVMEAR